MSPYGLWIGPGTTVGIAFCARSGKPLVRSSVTAEPCSGLSGKFLSEAQLHYPARCAGGQGGNRSKIGFTYSYRSIKPLPPFTILILVMIFLFLILRKRSRNKNVKIIIYHMSLGGRSVHIFSMGCCKSVRYDSKGCCSNNMLFLMLVFGDDYFICDSEKKIEKQKCEDHNSPHVTSHFKR